MIVIGVLAAILAIPSVVLTVQEYAVRNVRTISNDWARLSTNTTRLTATSLRLARAK